SRVIDSAKGHAAISEKSKLEGQCWLCGRWRELTREHIPPKSTFNLPSEMGMARSRCVLPDHSLPRVTLFIRKRPNYFAPCSCHSHILHSLAVFIASPEEFFHQLVCYFAAQLSPLD